MTNGRYYTGLILGLLTIVAASIYAIMENFFLEFLPVSYTLGAFVAELIWWDTLPMRIMKPILAFALVPISFSVSLIFSGGFLALILGIALFTPTVSIFATVAAFGATLGIFLSAFFFIFHIFLLRRDIY